MRPRRRRLWQQNSPIAPYSGSSDDDSPSDLSDADESNYSDGSVGSNFMPESLTSQQYTNITDFPSPVDEDSIIEPVENPHQEGNIIETIESPEPSAAEAPPEESIIPSPPHPIIPESQANITMADTALPSQAEPLSDASSRTLGRETPSSNPGTSSEAPSSDDEVTDRCYGFLLLHYPKSLPATLDTISILLIYQRRPHGLPPYWGFPKGHPEPEDHSDWESASRELLEETGLSPDRVTPITPAGFSPPLPDSVAGLRPDFMSVISQYPSFDGGIKEVTYFLARVAEMEKLTEQVEELVQCRWVKLSEARELVNIKPVRKVLEKLIGLVSSGPKQVVARSDWIRWKEVDALDDNGNPRQWRTVGFCTPE
ncbi:hypothetical protein V501_06777 [Pseudogymnoascus sp. VKM F-4519 (FW-2642)]|nr:hypothetical protein V501_06777 [Pseudogymnoascus sp. VKM F-4519 (FW-2642)]